MQIIMSRTLIIQYYNYYLELMLVNNNNATTMTCTTILIIYFPCEDICFRHPFERHFPIKHIIQDNEMNLNLQL